MKIKKIQKDQKQSIILRCQGSFALLRCFLKLQRRSIKVTWCGWTASCIGRRRCLVFPSKLGSWLSAGQQEEEAAVVRQEGIPQQPAAQATLLHFPPPNPMWPSPPTLTLQRDLKSTKVCQGKLPKRVWQFKLVQACRQLDEQWQHQSCWGADDKGSLASNWWEQLSLVRERWWRPRGAGGQPNCMWVTSPVLHNLNSKQGVLWAYMGWLTKKLSEKYLLTCVLDKAPRTQVDILKFNSIWQNDQYWRIELRKELTLDYTLIYVCFCVQQSGRIRIGIAGHCLTTGWSTLPESVTSCFVLP